MTLVSAGVSGWTFRLRVLASYEEGLARAFTDYGRALDTTRAVDNLQSSVNITVTITHNVTYSTEYIMHLFITQHSWPASVSQLGCCGIYNASDWVAMPFGQRNDPPFPPSCCSYRQDSICVLYNRVRLTLGHDCVLCNRVMRIECHVWVPMK